MLTTTDKDRIEAAVTDAEARTRGEIVCALAGEVSRYREVPLAWAAVMALAVPPLVLALGVNPSAGLSLPTDWSAAQASDLQAELFKGLMLYALAQAILFIVTALVVSLPAVRRRLTPASLKRHRVALAAHHHFMAISARAQGSDTGVLIFVALEDRQVQVLADGAIHGKTGEAVWTAAATAVANAMKRGHDPTSGILKAVALCGEALAEHFPATGEHAQVFSNRPMDV